MTEFIDIETFLATFHTKRTVWGILYRDDRGKNLQALIDLEISSLDRETVIAGLNAKDYCEGPLKDKMNDGPDMWVFGKLIKEKDVYIKITIGFNNSAVICISFHIAEYPLSYPFK